MTQLFKRTAQVKIRDRVITSDQLDIDITHTSFLNSFPTAAVTIWNPADKTIGECDSKKNVTTGVVSHPDVIVELGYGGNNEQVINGEVTSFQVDKRGMDRMLVINATEKGKIQAEFAMLTFIETTASRAIADLTFASFLSDAQRNRRIRVGEDKLITNMVVRKNLTALKNLISTTKSAFYTSAGNFMVIPADLVSRSPKVVDFNSGLLETPEKIDNTAKNGINKRQGFMVKTLPLPGVRAGSSLKVLDEDGEIVVNGVVYETKIKFPSRGEAMATHKVAA